MPGNSVEFERKGVSHMTVNLAKRPGPKVLTASYELARLMLQVPLQLRDNSDFHPLGSENEQKSEG
jgi:hypothetical protein